jgi:hypothetical protein
MVGAESSAAGNSKARAREVAMKRRLTTVVLLLAFALPTRYSLAQSNWAVMIPLHAHDGTSAACAPVPFDCLSTYPCIDVAGFQDGVVVLVCIFLHDDVVALQCAFEAPEWALLLSSWNCQSNQVTSLSPTMPLGETHGTLACVFDAIVSGGVAPIGYLTFQPVPEAGCISIVESSYPFGTHVVDRQGLPYPVIEWRRGRVCVGPAGWDPCSSFPIVEPTTWGSIRARYR